MEITGLGNIEAGLYDGGQYFQADLTTTLTFLENLGIRHNDLVLNDMDFFSVVKGAKDGKVKFLTPTKNNYITKLKENGCVWNPRGGISYSQEEAELCPHQIQQEQCPDVIPCWESLFGTGNQVESWAATSTGQKLVSDLLSATYEGIGNDQFAIATLGQHPIIDIAEPLYTGDADVFADIKSTLNVCGGWFTMIDQLAVTEGGQYAVPIHDSEFDGAKYIGDPEVLFERMQDAMPAVFKQVARRYKARGIRACILVTDSIYKAYQDKLKLTYTAFPDMLYYRMSNTFTSINGLNALAPAPGILGWGDFWVKCWDGLDVIAGDLQMIHHRATMVMPKIFGLGLDITDVSSSFKGMGLRMEASTRLPDAGKIYMSTNYKMGTALTDKRFIVNAYRWEKAAA